MLRNMLPKNWAEPQFGSGEKLVRHFKKTDLQEGDMSGRENGPEMSPLYDTNFRGKGAVTALFRMCTAGLWSHDIGFTKESQVAGWW